jgi:hypothetical protein
MNTYSGISDPWQQILNNLVHWSNHTSTPVDGANRHDMMRRPRTRASRSSRSYVLGAPSICRRIQVLDRESEDIVTIAWHDPTACYYGNQRWQRGKASRSGVCAVTGTPIARGADIFRPSPRRPHPVNAGAMILTTALSLI